jgi:hypothetical protein
MSRALVFLIVAAALSAADQVTFKTGEIIRGKIVKKDAGTITIKSDVLGEVTAPWGAVTAIDSDSPMVVVLPDGKSIIGRLRTSGDRLEVTSLNDIHSSPLSEVTALRSYEGGDSPLKYPGRLERLLRRRFLNSARQRSDANVHHGNGCCSNYGGR